MANGNAYTLVQCHFHWGSEHFVDGKQQAMEAHCVHTKDSQAGHYGVFGLFFEIGDTPSEFLAQFEDELPAAADGGNRRLSAEEAEELDLFGDVLNSERRRRLASETVSAFSGPVNFQKLYQGSAVDLGEYWSYDGSFTTPPCTEAVDWYVMMGRAKMTAAQLEKFKVAIGWGAEMGNFRPPSPIGERTVHGCMAPWYPYDVTRWSHLSHNANAICKDGHKQSPIDLPMCTEMASQPAITTNWAEQSVRLVNNGHTVQLTALGNPAGGMTIDGNTYVLKQCHFHWGSEHFIHGMQQVLEAHCVHQKVAPGEPDHYGVFGVFFEVGAPSTFLAQFEDSLPSAPVRRRLSEGELELDLFGEVYGEHARRLAEETVADFSGQIDFTQLHDGLDLTKYWSYDGSFTTPPCTEIVDWYVLMNKATLSQNQLDKFKMAIDWSAEGGNYRPPQPLKDRAVTGCKAPWYPYDERSWSHLSKKANAVCKDGLKQSPIDLSSCEKVDTRPRIMTNWPETNVKLFNNGHAVQVEPLSGPSGTMVVDGKSYTLVQCHFHWGS